MDFEDALIRSDRFGVKRMPFLKCPAQALGNSNIKTKATSATGELPRKEIDGQPIAWTLGALLETRDRPTLTVRVGDVDGARMAT